MITVPELAAEALSAHLAKHNAEHTMLVTLAGCNIMKGRALLVPTYPSDFAHVLVACLLHDIGYERGILKRWCGRRTLSDNWVTRITYDNSLVWIGGR